MGDEKPRDVERLLYPIGYNLHCTNSMQWYAAAARPSYNAARPSTFTYINILMIVKSDDELLHHSLNNRKME